MNTDFKILMECTFDYKGKKLHLMLLRENSMYGIEVVDNTKSFGRKMTDDRKDADHIFETLTERLNAFSSLKSAEDFLTETFAIKSLNKFRFSIMALYNVISQSDIVNMLNAKVKFKTRLQFGYNGSKKKKDALTVYIHLTNSKKPFGVLVGTTKANDFKFNFL